MAGALLSNKPIKLKRQLVLWLCSEMQDNEMQNRAAIHFSCRSNSSLGRQQ
ncbi:MAG: hypothetical protein N3D84_02305 [Candidatus Woesearchaeota archaeon]|nr:hypothetical protein [Candidatus Woesearchaeota archaeon]